MKRIKLLPMSIYLFDGGAAGGASGGGAAAGSGVGAVGATAGTNGSSADGQQSNTGGNNSNPPAAGEGNQGNDPRNNDLKERQRRYREMVDGEFKDLHTQDIQRILNKRFKETKGLQEQIDATAPIMQMLADRYGVQDPAKLAAALESDNAVWAQAAEEAGMTTDQFRQYKRMERENAQLRQIQEQAVNRERARLQMADWMKAAEQVKETYQDFDLEAEVNSNPNFIRLLKAGVDMKTAYEVAHINAIKDQTARETERRVADDIRARGSRPREAGISSQTGVAVSSDVANMTAKERQELIRRSRRGEHIDLSSMLSKK